MIRRLRLLRCHSSCLSQLCRHVVYDTTDVQRPDMEAAVGHEQEEELTRSTTCF